MDKLVHAALKKWPNVPAIYNRLHLSARGQWHLFDSDHGKPTPDTVVSSSTMLQFISRNYAADEQGNWYFQNGPQRVYVQLEKAPYIAYLDHETRLHTHTQQPIASVSSWWLTDLGELYANGNLGTALVSSQDVEQVCANLHTGDGRNILELLPIKHNEHLSATHLLWGGKGLDFPRSAPFCFTLDSKLPQQLAFTRYPCPAA
ncbi:DUF2946 family protein [Paenalcaligenes niemegkensis]|uniref:DUF2946 family protein n=1 Tax=Paenalcaligenes niemegkensis TaxID=2895469 RepID=UPI001EE8BF8D|nr:DUF2946 family protein [Paenalcaligenes niemegkensis]MCQ9617096.1 DUF2946 family protein [Paenalcaligenes niemegkensis]